MVLRRIEGRDVAFTAHRARQYSGMVFRYGIATGRCKRDPASDLRGALAPVQESNFPAVTEPKEFAAILRAIDAYDGTLTVRCALRLAPLVAVRPGELRKAEWKDIDLDKAEWRYVASKTHPNHIVPLSKQAVADSPRIAPAHRDREICIPRRAERQTSHVGQCGVGCDAAHGDSRRCDDRPRIPRFVPHHCR